MRVPRTDGGQLEFRISDFGFRIFRFSYEKHRKVEMRKAEKRKAKAWVLFVAPRTHARTLLRSLCEQHVASTWTYSWRPRGRTRGIQQPVRTESNVPLEIRRLGVCVYIQVCKVAACRANSKSDLHRSSGTQEEERKKSPP